MKKEQPDFNFDDKQELFYQIDESEISMIKSLNIADDTNFDNILNPKKKEISLLNTKDESRHSKSTNKSSFKIDRGFKEDEKRSNFTKKKKKNQFQKNNKSSNYRKSVINNLRVRSDDESDYQFQDNNFLGGKINSLDDSFNYNEHSAKMKTNYFNILIIGESGSGKFNFIEFMYKHCFKKNYDIDSEVKDFREFVSEMNNGKKSRRIISLIHSKGYDSNVSMKKWYKNIKGYIKDKLITYDELKKVLKKDKKFLKENMVDCRIHLCLFFIKAPSIKMNEMLYIQKLQKYVNIVPILVECNNSKKFDFESIKLNAKQELLNNNVDWFDLQEDDLIFDQFREDLLAKTTPFLISAKKGKIDVNSAYSDIFVLVKMLVTPYVNTYYYKTELIFNNNIEKINKKRIVERMKNGDKGRERDNGDKTLSFGIAIGIGFLGALVAVKNKLF